MHEKIALLFTTILFAASAGRLHAQLGVATNTDDKVSAMPALKQ